MTDGLLTKPGSFARATFVRGVALSPADALIAWIERQRFDGEPRLLRLPLILARGDHGFDLGSARIGPAVDAVVVHASDAALGIGLADRAHTACRGTDARRCGFLVEAYWRGEREGRYELAVMRADLLTPEQLALATFAEVEGESGN